MPYVSTRAILAAHIAALFNIDFQQIQHFLKPPPRKLIDELKRKNGGVEPDLGLNLFDLSKDQAVREELGQELVEGFWTRNDLESVVGKNDESSYTDTVRCFKFGPWVYFTLPRLETAQRILSAYWNNSSISDLFGSASETRCSPVPSQSQSRQSIAIEFYSPSNSQFSPSVVRGWVLANFIAGMYLSCGYTVIPVFRCDLDLEADAQDNGADLICQMKNAWKHTLQQLKLLNLDRLTTPKLLSMTHIDTTRFYIAEFMSSQTSFDGADEILSMTQSSMKDASLLESLYNHIAHLSLIHSIQLEAATPVEYFFVTDRGNENYIAKIIRQYNLITSVKIDQCMKLTPILYSKPSSVLDLPLNLESIIAKLKHRMMGVIEEHEGKKEDLERFYERESDGQQTVDTLVTATSRTIFFWKFLSLSLNKPAVFPLVNDAETATNLDDGELDDFGGRVAPEIGLYMQYTHARLFSIQSHLQLNSGLTTSNGSLTTALPFPSLVPLHLDSSTDIWTLIKTVDTFPDILKSSLKTHQSRILLDYLLLLSKMVTSSGIPHLRVKDEKRDEIRLSRWSVLNSCLVILQIGFSILGVDAVKRM